MESRKAEPAGCGCPVNSNRHASLWASLPAKNWTGAVKLQSGRISGRTLPGVLLRHGGLQLEAGSI